VPERLAKIDCADATGAMSSDMDAVAIIRQANRPTRSQTPTLDLNVISYCLQEVWGTGGLENEVVEREP
jgi:hypothetical protein